MKTRSSLVISILLLVFGAVCIYWGIGFVQSNSANWPSVPGKVASAQVDFSSSNGENEYYVDGTYSYSVGGAQYSGSFKTSSQSTESDAQRDLRSYSPGTDMTVYYDPKAPGTSTDSPGSVESTGLIGLAAGVFFLGSGGWSLRSYFVKGKAPVQSPAAE